MTALVWWRRWESNSGELVEVGEMFALFDALRSAQHDTPGPIFGVMMFREPPAHRWSHRGESSSASGRNRHTNLAEAAPPHGHLVSNVEERCGVSS